MHICPKCNNIIPDNNFCLYCGATQQPQDLLGSTWNAGSPSPTPDQQPVNGFQWENSAPSGSIPGYNENEVAQDIAEKIRQIDQKGKNNPQQGYFPQGNSVPAPENGSAEVPAGGDILFANPQGKKPRQAVPAGNATADTPVKAFPGRGYTPSAGGKKLSSAVEPDQANVPQTPERPSSPAPPLTVPGRGYTPRARKTAEGKPVQEKQFPATPLVTSPLPETSAAQSPDTKKPAETPMPEKPVETPSVENPGQETPEAAASSFKSPAGAPDTMSMQPFSIQTTPEANAESAPTASDGAAPANEPVGLKSGESPVPTPSPTEQQERTSSRFSYETNSFAEIILTRSDRPLQSIRLPFDADAEPLVTPPAVMIPSVLAEFQELDTEEGPVAAPAEDRPVEPVHQPITGDSMSTPAPSEKPASGPAAAEEPEATEKPGASSDDEEGFEESDPEFCDEEEYEIEDVPPEEEVPTRRFRIPKRRFKMPAKPADDNPPQKSAKEPET